MSEQCCESLRFDPQELNSALAIHTQKITDACRDKDCIEDLRVYLTGESQSILDSATSAKVRTAELIYTAIDVTPVAFNRNHYTVDLTFYYKVIADALIGGCRPATLCGLAMFSKRAILCGENSGAHVFRSDSGTPSICRETMPTAVVEVLDPIVLSSKVVSVSACDPSALKIPTDVQSVFGDDLVLSGDRQRLFVTLGQFSIIRLERSAQLIVPVLDYAIPTKECCTDPGCAEDPCEVFSRIPFPAQSFAPTGCCEQTCGCRQES